MHTHMHTLNHTQYTYRQILLVANEHDGHVGVGILSSIFQPAGKVVECFTAGNVIHQQGTRCTTVVGARDGPKRLLPSLGIV